MTQAPVTAERRVGLRSERGPVLASVMLTTSLVALDSTIIATAVPSVVRDLGGFAHFPWLFSVYLLTAAVTTPLYGKLADMLGRRPVMFFGIAVFLAGSVLCGAAWSMLTLIIARAVQGIGAGAIQPMSMTIIGDLYTVEERARVQGYVAGVWGVSSVVGPTLGGVFSEYLSWRWIFFVNLPLGLAAAWMLARHLKERVERRRHRIDYLGAGLLVGGCSLLILGTLEGGVTWAWASAPSIAVFTAGALLTVAFVFVERRAAEPVLPLWVFRHRTLVGGNLAAVIVGGLLIGLSSYVPNFAQGVLGASAVVAGFVVAAMTFGWPIAATLSGHVYLRIGFRNTALVGAVVIVIGTVMCALLGRHTSIGMVAAACFVIGLGLGFTSSPSLVAVQSVVGWERRGVVTATNMFSRSIGSAVGAAVFGAIANTTLERRFAAAPPDIRPELAGGSDATSLVLKAGHASGAVADYVRASLYAATHHVFIGLAVVGAFAVVALLLMPRRTEQLPAE
ncbi:MDR family MFS transporter [Dactylosporangium sp. AC04546]|uniref:MDR family MFS transporter n=1 Tax=Dactylosporangium sp. AC04546 TaxID=2862460 RepID=UPI001EDEE89A|nr:MDR family MFS transporter [Dactylosporangium sp. AC04546]WVK79884.1 MDR family MFS transporter [Dactylosporangium sp. AC04546]